MRDLNRIRLIGTVTTEPELSYLQDGTARTTFDVQTVYRYTKADGTPVEEPEVFHILVWDRLAEICGEYLQVGRRAYLEGRLRTRNWTDQQGQHWRTEVVLTELLMLDTPPPPTATPPGPSAKPFGVKPHATKAIVRPPVPPGGKRGDFTRYVPAPHSGVQRSIRQSDPIPMPEDLEPEP